MVFNPGLIIFKVVWKKKTNSSISISLSKNKNKNKNKNKLLINAVSSAMKFFKHSRKSERYQENDDPLIYDDEYGTYANLCSQEVPIHQDGLILTEEPIPREEKNLLDEQSKDAEDELEYVFVESEGC